MHSEPLDKYDSECKWIREWRQPYSVKSSNSAAKSLLRIATCIVALSGASITSDLSDFGDVNNTSPPSHLGLQRTKPPVPTNMLSRSSSNATGRIHRAKSTSSAHASTSGHQRLPTIADPLGLRRQAETAAVEAYSRARQQDEEASALVSNPRPNRRRSQKTGRSEGSHFADARRRSIQSEAVKSTNTSHQSPPARSRSTADEETFITRRRSIILPVVDTAPLTESPAAAPPLRKRNSGYTDGSPAPRYSQLEDSASILHSCCTEGEQADGYAGNLAQLSNFTQNDATQNLRRLDHVPAQGIEVDALQIVQPKRVRQRRSFLGSFQKRNSGFDTALPPFNHADSEMIAPNAGLSLAAAPGIVLEAPKPRNFSDTLKGRLKKVFRKASKTSVPIQHVHAKDFHFSLRDHDVSDASFIDYTDPFMTVLAEEPKPPHHHRFATAKSANSTVPAESATSRVTSWANSTLAMSSVRTSNGPFAVPGQPRDSDKIPAAPTGLNEAEANTRPGEQPSLNRSDSTATLRKASSFFGRPIRNKLRRNSKADLRGSDESQGLYSALQSRIRTSRSTETANEAKASTPLESTTSHEQGQASALATLPSQRQYSTSSALSSGTSSQSRHRAGSLGVHNRNLLAPTIRPVTPELAPVLEVASAEADRTMIHHEIESPAEGTPISALRRSHAMKALPPSKEQLSKRKERADNRWTTALKTDGLKPNSGNNPYELPSLSQHNRAPSPYMGSRLVSRADVISPSLYSRATDGASPRPDTPDDVGITSITITGREVRKYDISPPKHAHQHQSSRDWRKWLSNEMDSFAGDDKQPSRPASGASMNGRYPIINRSRNSSLQSVSRRPGGDDIRGGQSMAASRKPSIETAMYAHGLIPATRHRTLSKPKSIAEIGAAASTENIPNSDPCSASISPDERSTKGFTRPKSAFELRVNYRNNAADRAKPLEVRRKIAEPSILEDHTMLNIYAGPYASSANCENQRPAELEGSGLPALSSSEWLSSTKKGPRKTSSKTPLTKHSPQRSPGQRMVTSWLDEKSKENVSAFV